MTLPYLGSMTIVIGGKFECKEEVGFDAALVHASRAEELLPARNGGVPNQRPASDFIIGDYIDDGTIVWLSVAK